MRHTQNELVIKSGILTRRGLLSAAALACSVLVGLSACERKEAPGASGNAAGSAQAAGDEWVIGHYGSLTGAQATFGRSTDNGIKLAVEEANKAGGVTFGGVKKKIRLVSDDTESKAEKAGAVVTKLITKDKVICLLGEVASKVSLAGADVAQPMGVPMITPSSTNPDVTKKGDMIFRVCFIDPFQGQVCAKFAREDLKVANAAVLFDQAGAYSVGLKDEFVANFKKMGGKIVSEQAYNEGDSDFNAQLTRIREAKPELLFIPGYYTDVANIARQARKLGMTMPLLGGDGWDSEDLAKNGGEAVEGAYYSNHYAPDQPSPEIEEFVTKYKSAFGSVPDGLAALGYDAAKILFDAMERSPNPTRKDLRDAIAATKNQKCVTGTISLNDDRDAVKSAVIVQMKGGKPVFRASIAP
ncbi:MAG: ABC transporter substrate-binding protein [Phycisphaerae bacterium]|nr:ABC transporter substrate-binding protein [Phycisphaerae bacterium]